MPKKRRDDLNKLELTGGQPLRGGVRIQGSKNAVLPMLAASLLTEGRTVLTNCPHIQDVYIMIDLLKELGCKVKFENHVIEIDASVLSGCEIKSASAGRVRSSVMLLGSLLGRCGKAILPYPGGCVIGKRPINIHLEMLREMGVVIEKDKDCFSAETKGIQGATLQFFTKSVGAAENCIMAAVLAKGVTRLRGVAIEPEVMELCNLLRKMGAVILRTDYDELLIKGVKKLKSVEYSVPSDRIVAGTYMLAVAGTRGKAYFSDVPVRHMQMLFSLLRKMNIEYVINKDEVFLDATGNIHGISGIRTASYPGFPTDLQSPLVAAMTMQDKKCIVEETIFEERFHAVLQMRKMGADITVEANKIFINPVQTLKGSDVEVRDLRGGAALVIAGLMAEGTTVADGCHYIERGYENIIEDFENLGAGKIQIIE